MGLAGLAVFAILAGFLVRNALRKRRHLRLERHRVRILVDAVRHPHDEGPPWQLVGRELTDGSIGR